MLIPDKAGQPELFPALPGSHVYAPGWCRCGGALKYHHGFLGYESMICARCGLDVRDDLERQHAEALIDDRDRRPVSRRIWP